MRLDIVPETFVERLLVSTGLIPKPLAHTMLAILMSRTILAAAKLGVFKALADGPIPPDRLAAACRIDEQAGRKLLRALSGLGYVRESDQGFELTSMSRKWLGADDGQDLTDALLHRFLDMKLMDNAEEYLRTGLSFDFHEALSDDEWRTYMNGQQAQALLYIPELLRRVKVPKEATTLLDLGGGHGLYADAMCRKYPKLRAVVLDLPGAVGGAARAGLTDRVTFRAGNILEDDPNPGAFDLVFVGNVLHHFDSTRCRNLVFRAAGLLQRNGVLIVADFFHPPASRSSSQIPALLDFYFAVTSGGGTVKSKELRGWMQEAGLAQIRMSNMLSVPGMKLVTGSKVSPLVKSA